MNGYYSYLFSKFLFKDNQIFKFFLIFYFSLKKIKMFYFTKVFLKCLEIKKVSLEN
jgi:hypothetical protein